MKAHDLKRFLVRDIDSMLLVFCNERNIDEFVVANLKESEKDMRIIRGSRCLTKENLFQEWAAALQFPYYFGNNWDAFEECMNDLEWLSADEIIVFITQVDHIFFRDEKLFGLLIKILDASHKCNTDYGNESCRLATSFSIIFQSEVRHARELKAFFKKTGIKIKNIG